jgi:hypothetical protein
MYNDIIVIPDFLKDPDFIRELALKQDYHTKTGNKGWVGKRTDSLHKIVPNEFNEIFGSLFQKLFYTNNRIGVKYKWNVHANFHLIGDGDVVDNTTIHQDPDIFGGVIYLNPSSPSNSGTFFYDENKEKCHSVENNYNTLIMFKGENFHRVGSGFGKTNNDSRLTLVFFVKQLEFKAQSLDL